MKKGLSLFFVLVLSTVYAQQQKFSIDWQGSKILSTENSSIELPVFSLENYNYSQEKGLLYISHWPINQLIEERTASIVNVNYAEISKSELKDLDLNTIPKTLQFKVSNSVSRNTRKAFVSLSPIINDNGTFKKVLSFVVNYKHKTSRQSKGVNSITNSVLRQGEWYKFYIDTTGVFKLTKSFLSSIGVNTNNIDPRTVKLFGQGAKMLPMSNSSDYPIDLTENAIQFVGEEDGVFNDNDYILFYGIGPKGFQEETNSNINPYTDKSYYFINISSGNGKRIQPLQEPDGEAIHQINSYNDYLFHENDEYNIAQIGRRWFGDRFYFENERVFTFDIPGIDTAKPIKINVYAAAASDLNTSMQVLINGANQDVLFFNKTSSNLLGDDDSYIGEIPVNSQNITVKLIYDNSGNPSSLGFLDFISIEAERSLSYTNGQFQFKNNSTANLSGIGQFNISNASAIHAIWDITDQFNITSFNNIESSSSVSFKTNFGEVRTYVALDESDFFNPKKDSNSFVANQNIKGTIFLGNSGGFQDIDYLIITPNEFQSQAERLANINRDKNNLNVKVVTLQEIYNEFSSGNQDISGIRNFVKYVYDNASNPDKRLKYLCLFGDASYDYKDRIENNTNFAPSWLAYSSFSLISSYISDDFFVQLDDNEGLMQVSEQPDVAVGRILADSPQRAKDLVDKIETYYSVEALGAWKHNFVVISDDVDVANEYQLQKTSDEIADEVSEFKPFINPIKIHSDAYTQQSTAGGERYPEVNKAIIEAIENGASVINYFGHGGEDGLASERIFDKIDAQELNNTCRLNCFVTVTCEFTKFDNPLRPTAGEYTYWNKNGGSIALITTTRQIFIFTGVNFNTILRKYLFAYNSNDYPTMAEALRLTKNDPIITNSQQKRLVFFIGDPAMKLNFPQPDIQLTKINDVPVAQGIEVLQALSTAKIEGEVTDENGNILTSYNGVITATVFDKNIERTTLGNDGVKDSNGQLLLMDFTTLGEKIFTGQATVTNGLFEFNFVVPKDIEIPIGNGKINIYSKTNNNTQERAGSSFEVQFGGINENAPTDNEGPNISLYMNDENFVSGGITNEAPSLVAKLFDENGINTSSGIGHDINAILDGDETNPFKLNDYYIADVDTYKSGSISYPLRDLEPGLHTLTVKAWDVYNNSSTSEIQFIVHNQNEELIINNVLNYPNPFVNYTEFWFNHNSSEVLDVSIQIFTVSGKLIKTLNGQTNFNDQCCGAQALSKDIVWDGRDDFGDRIGKGVYVYKLIVRSPNLNKQVEKIQKLVIL